MSISQTPEKTPKAFCNTRLIATDFDGTAAKTFERSPGGIDVDEAYVRAVDEVFGPSAVDQYFANGGLSNRAPIEVVQSLAPDARDRDLEALAEGLNHAKLAILMGEIGTRFNDGSVWPRPTNGYLEFLKMLETTKAEGTPIDSLILSSGHESFIREVCKAWGVKQPDYVVAEERLRRLKLAHHVKPSPTLMDVALNTWADDYKASGETALLTSAHKRTIYVGDDDLKDGQMARDSGVEFFLVSLDTANEVWPRVATRLGLARAASNGDLLRGE